MDKKDKNIISFFLDSLFGYSYHDKTNENKISDKDRAKVKEIINANYTLTFGIIGSKGTGKSTTLKCLFGIDDDVKETEDVVPFVRDLGPGKGIVTFYDFPGFGDVLQKKEFIENRYREFLPKCDVILWVFEAKSRVFELDQQFIRTLPNSLKTKIVVGLSQVDLVPPYWEWNREARIPSRKQKKFITDKINLLSTLFDLDKDKFVPYCSLYSKDFDARYNIAKLVKILTDNASEDQFRLSQAFAKETMAILNEIDKKLVADIISNK